MLNRDNLVEKSGRSLCVVTVAMSLLSVEQLSAICQCWKGFAFLTNIDG